MIVSRSLHQLHGLQVRYITRATGPIFMLQNTPATATVRSFTASLSPRTMGQITNRNSDDSSSDYNAANSNTLASPSPSKASKEDSVVPARLPRSVQAIYLKPLRREPQFGVPSCDLQMRSYSVRNLEFFADFALRAAYYLKLPAFGPVPLPRITERWTVPRSNFIFKKSQENFERITKRRLIQIKDGHPETVGLWLAFLKKHAYYGVGMKANIWDYDELGVGKTMDVSVQNLENILEPKWTHFGRKRNLKTSEKVMDLMNTEKFKLASGHNQPMTWASLSEN